MEERCCICYLENCDITLHCGHLFHKECIHIWNNISNNYKCVYCTQFFNIDDLKLLDIELNPGIINYKIIKEEYGLIKYMLLNNIINDRKTISYIMDRVAYNGDLEMLKWLHYNQSEGCTKYAMSNASSQGKLETLKWLHYNRTEGCNEDAMDYASMNGHFETLKWLYYNRTEGCSSDAICLAMTRKHFEIVRWLHYNTKESNIYDAIIRSVEYEKHINTEIDTDLFLKELHQEFSDIL